MKIAYIGLGAAFALMLSGCDDGFTKEQQFELAKLDKMNRHAEIINRQDAGQHAYTETLGSEHGRRVTEQDNNSYNEPLHYNDVGGSTSGNAVDSNGFSGTDLLLTSAAAAGAAHILTDKKKSAKLKTTAKKVYNSAPVRKSRAVVKRTSRNIKKYVQPRKKSRRKGRF